MSTFTGTGRDDFITPWRLSDGVSGPANEKPAYDGDNIYGLGGNDTLDGGGAGGQIHGGAGNDMLNGYADSGTISLYGDGGDDYLRVKSDDGSPSARLYGGDGSDTLQAASNYNNAPFGVGDNILSGGRGDDHYIVFSSADKVVEAAGGGTDSVNSWADFTLPANAENLTLLMSEYVSYDNVRARGNALDNIIEGNSENNRIDGLAGDDTIYGRSAGLPQQDIYGDAHTDADVIHGGTGNDVIYGGDGKLTWDGADRLYGDAGNDILNGGLGRDVLSGGAGSDVYAYGAVAESPASGQRDHILDFTPGGASGDRIDLSDVDANATLGGLQHFSFVNGGALSAGQLRVVDAVNGNSSVVQGEVDGKAGLDFAIQVDDGDHAAADWSAADFILV